MKPDSSRWEKRIARIRRGLIQHERAALLILNMNHIRYLVGFSGSDGVLLVGGSKVFLLVDGRYTTQAATETDAEIVEFKDKIEGIRQVIDQEGFNEIKFDSGSASYDFYVDLKAKIEEVDLKPVTKEIEMLRIIKDDEEISRIARAAEIASCALLETMKNVKAGLEERELALELEYRMRLGGGEAVSFETICASGPNAALPHARPGHRKIEAGEFIVIDFGTVFMGYHSDETCTIAVDGISQEQKEVYAIVRAAHDLGMEKIKAGVACAEIDRVVREYIQGKGYGAFFNHGTGHGVGLEVHEPPRLSRLADSVLEAGMVVTIEPGIYLPNKWGVRIEDLVVVKEDGFEILSRVPKDLQVMPVR